MILPIEYSDLLILVLAIFAFVGLMRGWYREGITSLFVAVLALLVWQPEIARELIDAINKLITLILMLIKSGFSLDPVKIAAQTVDPGQLLDPSSYRLYIVVTVIMVIVSYMVGEATFQGKTTPLGRLLGGILGVCNGYVILSLVKQYLVNYTRAKGQVVAETGELSIQLTDVPAENFFTGYGIIFVFVILIAVVALLIAGDRLKLPLK
jgi:uncharacterized membrane protein required for colicin V production